MLESKSLSALASAVRDAVASGQCTTRTAADLQVLLGIYGENDATRNTKANKSIASGKRSDAGTTASVARSGPRPRAKSGLKTTGTNLRDNGTLAQELDAQAKMRLATDVVNSSLQALTMAVKEKAAKHQQRRPRALQPLSPNQKSRVPEEKKQSGSGPLANDSSTMAMAACADAAFMALRQANVTMAGSNEKQAMLRLVQGIYSFTTKLVALGIDELAESNLALAIQDLQQISGGKEPSTRNHMAAKSGALSLLSICTIPDNATARELLIMCQIQALKVVGRTRTLASRVAALNMLLDESQTTVISVLEQEIDSLTPESATKYGRYCEQISQAVHTLVDNLSDARQPSGENSRSLSRVRIACGRVLELRMKCRSWILTASASDISRNLTIPLATCMSQVAREPGPCKKSDYEQLCAHIKTFVQHANNLPVDLVEPSKLRMLEASAYRALAHLAKDLDSHQASIDWLQKCFIHKYDVLPTCLTTTLRCQLASVQLHFRKHVSSNDLEDTLRSACESLNNRLQGSHSDIDDLLVGLSSLRKQTMAYLLGEEADLDQRMASAQPACRRLCKKFISDLPRFLRRILEHLNPQATDPVQDKNHQQRLKLVAQVAKPAIDAAALLGRPSLSNDDDSDRDIICCYQECAQLAVLLEEAQMIPQDHGPKQSIFVNVSNAIWFRYLQRRRLERPELLRPLLSQAIKILEPRPEDEKIAGFLAVKHEKLAGLLDSTNDLAAAVEHYKKAIINHPQFGSSDRDIKFESQSGSSPLELTITCLAIRAKLCFARRTLLTPLSFDELDRSKQRLCLELQLKASLESVQSDKPLVNPEFFTSLYHQIVAARELADAPEDQLILELRILHAACLDRTSIPEEILDELLNRPLLKHPGSNDSHLRSQRELYSIMLMAGDVSAMEPLLISWHIRIQDVDSLRELLQTIDVEAWLSQLKFLETFLRLQGNIDLHLQILEMLSAICCTETAFDANALVLYSTTQSDQLLNAGRPASAGRCLLSVQRHVKPGELSTSAALWHLSYADYQLAIGNSQKCEAVLAQLRAQLQDTAEGAESRTWRPTRYEFSMILSRWMHQQSKLAYQREQHGLALYCARKSSKTAYRSWALFERQRGRPSTSMNSDTLQNETSATELCVSTRHDSLGTATFQHLVPSLFEHNIHLVRILLDSGLVLEAQYYAEQASRIATASKSRRYQVQIAILNAEISVHRSEASAALTTLEQVAVICKQLTLLEQAEYHLALAKAHHVLSAYDSEAQVLKAMELLLGDFESSAAQNPAASKLDILEIENGMGSLTIASGGKLTAPTHRQPTRNKRARPAPVGSTNARIEKPVSSTSYENVLLSKLQAERLRQSCVLALTLGDADLASSLLSAVQRPSSRSDAFEHELCQAALFLDRATSTLAKDPVFSLLQESAIMLPSKLLSAKEKNNDNLPSEIHEPTVKSRVAKPRKVHVPVPKVEHQTQTTKSSEDPLHLCDHALLQSAKAGQLSISTIGNHKYADILAKTQLLLSATTGPEASAKCNPLLSSWAFELGRSVAYTREDASIVAERLLEADREQSQSNLPQLPEIPTVQIEAKAFQESYVDIIPQTWTTVSIALSESHNELRISRLRASKVPITLTIPLDRHNPRDCDEEVFGFTEGKSELQEIISLANFSAHDAGDLSKKGAKTAWWEARAALDARLKDLMVNIENMWLGGFRGLLSQHVADPHLLARFQQSMINILNKHLPSRQPGSKKIKQTQVALDPQVLELFVGLGDPSCQPDMDETLIDLFYFIVDILQFNGERNAYDEIDFDPMIIETMDALTQYHSAFNQQQKSDTTQHTVLILDKALHLFPWEAMPFVDGHAISRLPSLSSLRDRLLMLRADGNVEDGKSAMKVSADNGAYVLNPSSDLPATLKTFKQPLSALTSWDVTMNSIPSEREISTYLNEKDIYLYFGHGSGGQYIRSRTIRRMPKCAVSLLMGCSSAIMTEAGKLESYGVPLTYLHAGAPAVVGTLWDVTDKDIDRYSLKVLERWGLLKPKAAAEERKEKKGKTKVKGDDLCVLNECGPSVSLDKAVAEARSSCILRYLNGAAPVVYGIPVTLA